MGKNNEELRTVICHIFYHKLEKRDLGIHNFQVKTIQSNAMEILTLHLEL
jgi:hypothetical protein